MIDLFPFVRPFLHALDPETAHELTLQALERGLVPPQPEEDDSILATELFGRSLRHPLGLAAGFDKNARVHARMFAQGFSFVEVGGVTPLPQAGNPRPRVFRLPAHGAVINRMGFPNAGGEVVLERMHRGGRPSGMLGVNLASNTDSADPLADFVSLVERFSPHADYLVLDISCPNTSNGQMFLDPGRLTELLTRCKGIPSHAPLLAKLSPDIDDARLETILEVLLAEGIEGLVVSNTTTQRPELQGASVQEKGGLSGRPLREISTRMLAKVRERIGVAVPIIGVGGISSGADAYAKIRAGARVLQLYTALVYAGPSLVTQIKRDLAALLRRDGFGSLAQAVGVDV